MAVFLVRRGVAGVLTLIAIATLAFIISRFAPGNPFSAEKMHSPEVIRNLERRYGFDKPLLVQYWRMMTGYLRGDLGPSYQYPGRDVGEILRPGLAVSLRLGGITFVFAMIVGVLLGVIASARQNRSVDHLAMSLATFGICVPNFLLGPLLVIVLFYWLGWFLPTGWPQSWTSPVELKKLVMPVITLGLAPIAYLARLTRAGMLDVLHKDFIRTARAKGLPESAVFLKHGLKNGATPALTYSGPMAAYLVTGSIVVEKIFAIPGLGTPFVNSVFARDYGIVMGTVLIYSGIIIILNIVVDILYGVLDPRVRVN